MSQPTPDYLLLHRAIREGDLDSVVAILDAGVSVHAAGSMLGNSPFHTAVLNNQLEIADLLLSRGADVHQPNKYGHTPLYTALRAGRTGQADYLLAHGADIHLVDDSGNTYLHQLVANHSVFNQQNPSENAAAADLVRGVEWLLAHDIDTRAKNNAGQDAEALAAEAPEMLNKLRVLKAKASIDTALRNARMPAGLAP